MAIPDQNELTQIAEALLDACRRSHLKIATAESCTGGLIMAIITEVCGSSHVVERGFITYSNEAKIEMLGVDKNLIDDHGAVSAPVAIAMAEGALKNSNADVVVSVTGIAGPGGGSDEKPVGLVHMAVIRKGGSYVHEECRFGDVGRTQVRLLTVEQAFRMLRSLL